MCTGRINGKILMIYLEVQCIITKGRADSDQWMTEFSVKYSNNTQTFHDVTDPDEGSVIVFTGPSDQHTPVENLMPSNIVGRYVRIYTVSWHSRTSFRAEIIACELP